MAQNRIVIRGGYLITMDQDLGDLPGGDILVEGRQIVRIAPSIDVSDAREIDAGGALVMPGLVDTHRHTWQTQMRGLCADWTVGDYFLGMRLAISRAYSSDDVYLGNYLGALEAIQSGVTTFAAVSKADEQPFAIAFKPRHLTLSSSLPPRRWASESRPCVRRDRHPREVPVGQG